MEAGAAKAMVGVAAWTLIVTSSAGPGRTSPDQFMGLCQERSPPPPSQEMAARRVRGSRGSAGCHGDWRGRGTPQFTGGEAGSGGVSGKGGWRARCEGSAAGVEVAEVREGFVAGFGVLGGLDEHLAAAAGVSEVVEDGGEEDVGARRAEAGAGGLDLSDGGFEGDAGV